MCKLGAQSCKGLESEPLQDCATLRLIETENVRQKLLMRQEKSAVTCSQCEKLGLYLMKFTLILVQYL